MDMILFYPIFGHLSTEGLTVFIFFRYNTGIGRFISIINILSKMWFFNKEKSLLGVDLGAGGVKVVELRKVQNRPLLFTYGFTSETQNIHQLFIKKEKSAGDLLKKDGGKKEPSAGTEENPENERQVARYADILRGVCQAAKTTAKNAVVSLPVSAVFHAVVTLPVVDKKDFLSILNAEVKKLLPRPLDEMAVDYQILPAAGEEKNQRILINAVPRELVVFYTKVFQRAGLILEALEPESMALQRSLVGRDSSVTLIIDMGAERTNFFIIDQTVPITHHSIETGGVKINKILQETLGVEEGLVEQIKQDISVSSSDEANKFLEIFMPVLDPMFKEIQYSFDVFLRQSGNENKRPEKIILTGGAAMFPGLASYISEKFNIKCYVGDPWARVVYQDSLRPVLSRIGPRLSVAIGLALRDMVQ